MHSHVTGWGWFWVGWAATALGVELYWVVANAANTLSRQIWGLEGMDLAHPFDFASWSPLHWIMAVVFLAGFGWLALHLAFGLLR